MRLMRKRMRVLNKMSWTGKIVRECSESWMIVRVIEVLICILLCRILRSSMVCFLRIEVVTSVEGDYANDGGWSTGMYPEYRIEW
ncbi:hypothetical protein BDQ12DRAFT_692415 [Crucibulum laeve]|uniref:Uncharacterized protein n=1 Tax=Crucibulum laeve TaxID=68775 RepID=A0A5C3LI44_9AGAR|nr:hypothetical protein BDQ12DRAFT_692415 [Crucibulum laeve]